MNSVHEPGSRTMSKNRLRNNTESTRIENRPRAPSAQPVASPRSPRAYHACCHAPCLPRAPAPAACRLRTPRAPAPARPPACLPAPQCLRSPAACAPQRSACAPQRSACAPSTSSRAPSRPSRAPSAQQPGCSCHKTICCIVTQAQPTLSIGIHSSVLQYTSSLSSLTLCNTMIVLQYKIFP